MDTFTYTLFAINSNHSKNRVNGVNDVKYEFSDDLSVNSTHSLFPATTSGKTDSLIYLKSILYRGIIKNHRISDKLEIKIQYGHEEITFFSFNYKLNEKGEISSIDISDTFFY